MAMMRIGEVAQQAGVNVQTLRYYERRGLLPRPSRRPSGYREYSPGTARLVRFIKRAQELGFSLEDAAELIALRERPGRNRTAVRGVATRRVADIAGRIRRLTAMQKALEQLVSACECGATAECPIIDALDDDSIADVVRVRGRTITSGGTYAKR